MKTKLFLVTYVTALLLMYSMSTSATATTLNIFQSFPDNQGYNGLYAYSYNPHTNTYTELNDAGSYAFNYLGSWNNPNIWKTSGWWGLPNAAIDISPSGTQGSQGILDGVLGYMVPNASNAEVKGTFDMSGAAVYGGNVYVKLNNSTLWSSFLYPGNSTSFDLTNLTLNAGDFIYFGVGARNDVYFSENNEWAGLNGLIVSTPLSQTAQVPEPATMLLFGTGIASLAGSRIRRKKK